MRKSVFVCDDDEGILEVTKMVLESVGYEVMTFSDCENLYNTIGSSTPSVIILDLWMPQIGGEEVTKWLKENPLTAQIPVIIVSATRDIHSVAKRVGADGALCKPFNIAELEQIVGKFSEREEVLCS